MTIEETGIIMDILTAAYPRFYSGANVPDKENALMVWAEMFADDDVNLVRIAVKSLIEADDKGYPPHIGAVKAKIRLITGGDGGLTEEEAWNLVRKAISNAGYEAKKEFDRLPENVRRLVGSPNQLREWAMMDISTVQSVVASNFQRSYRSRAQKEREIAALPSDVKRMLASVGDRMALNEAETDGG